MKLKAIEILNMYDAFTKLADKELDLNTACIIAKNIKELALSKEIIDKKRNNIIYDLSAKDEQNNIKYLEDGAVEISDITVFNSKMTKLLNTEIEAKIYTIKMQALSEIKIQPKDILPLMNIIEE